MHHSRLLLATCALCAAAPACAADAAADADAIVVTGIRQPYRGDFTLKETPAAVAVIDAREIERNNIQRLSDALDLNASVSRQNNFGGLWDSFAIRGFVGDENIPSGYLVNGFNAGRGFGGPRDAAGVERIEILKGPQAALLGRGEPGGAINIVTKRAGFDRTFGTLSALGGSFDRFRADADINLAVAGPVAVRLIGFYESADSFRDLVDSERWGLLPSVSVKLSDRTTFTYDLELTRQDIVFDRGVPAINGRLDVVPRNRFLGEPADGPLEGDATGHQFQLEHKFSDRWSLLLGGSHRETSLEGISTEAELVRSRQTLFRDGRSLSRQRRFRDYDAEHSVARAELAGDARLLGLRHRVLIGADYDDFSYGQLFLRSRPPVITAATTPQAAYVIDVFAPVYGRFPPPALAPQVNRLDEQQAVGVYLQDQISLSDRLQVRLGGRYDSLEQASLNRASGVRQTRDFDRFSPQAGVVFTVSPAFTLYAAYGEGFRANIGADFAGRIFEPETSRSVEAGVKFDLFGRALSGTFAVFDLRKSNVLAADPANPGFSLPIGRAASTGVELDLTGKLGGVDLLLSYAYVDARALSTVADVNFGLTIRPGDRLINIPAHNLNAQASRRFQLGTRALMLGAGVQHVGDRLGEVGTSFTLPAYTLVRAFGSFEVVRGVELFGDVRNLFDTTWYQSSFAALWVAPGAPLSGNVGLRARF